MRVISSEEFDILKAISACSRRNARLLSMLNRKSSDRFRQFLSALIDSGQRHVAERCRRSLTGDEEHPKSSENPSRLADSAKDAPVYCDWWLKLSQREADKLLLSSGNPPGTYLIRFSNCSG